MLQITEKSKQGFKDACEKLGHADTLPGVTGLPEDKALYITAVYMMITIVEARKDGKVNDITNHDVRKYEPVFFCDEGYKPGSASGGFSFFVNAVGRVYSTVGARLSSNSSQDARYIAENHPDLYEIIILNVK